MSRYAACGGVFMFKINPYRPGAGLMPVYLAGRDDEVETISGMFDALKMNIPVQSIIYSGLRGVGKTVLLNRLQNEAEEKGIFCKHIEIEEKNDFIAQIAECSQDFLRSVSATERMRHLIEKSLNAIKSLVISFNPGNKTFSVSVQEQDLYKSSSLTQSLTDVFVSIGKTALEAHIPICFFVDEIQYMKQEQLGSLIAALHRVNQLSYPMMVIGAGLPKIYKMLSDEKSYSERLFMYQQIDSLTEEQAKKAIEEPARKFHVNYSKEAVDRIISITRGYPFFIQQLCQIVYNRTEENVILLEHVDACQNEFFEVLDKGFFRARYERCSESDKKFIFAMVKCGVLPCTIANVAKNLRKAVGSISTIRAQLISKGIIYPVRYKELDFTVPEFSGFILRLREYEEWEKEMEEGEAGGAVWSS